MAKDASILLRIDSELKKQAEEVAAKNDRSLSSLIRVLLQQVVNNSNQNK